MSPKATSAVKGKREARQNIFRSTALVAAVLNGKFRALSGLRHYRVLIVDTEQNMKTWQGTLGKYTACAGGGK